MYVLPKYDEVDPTFILSIFYWVFFGMMVADFAYGLILCIGSGIADSIFYFIAILSIPAHLFEAAEIDGATRLQVIGRIILPALVAPMLTVFIMNLGFFLNAGFDQVLNFSNNAILSTIDILDTYIYRIGIENGQYSRAEIGRASCRERV